MNPDNGMNRLVVEVYLNRAFYTVSWIQSQFPRLLHIEIIM